MIVCYPHRNSVPHKYAHGFALQSFILGTPLASTKKRYFFAMFSGLLHWHYNSASNITLGDIAKTDHSLTTTNFNKT